MRVVRGWIPVTTDSKRVLNDPAGITFSAVVPLSKVWLSQLRKHMHHQRGYFPKNVCVCTRFIRTYARIANTMCMSCVFRKNPLSARLFVWRARNQECPRSYVVRASEIYYTHVCSTSNCFCLKTVIISCTLRFNKYGWVQFTMHTHTHTHTLPEKDFSRNVVRYIDACVCGGQICRSFSLKFYYDASCFALFFK